VRITLDPLAPFESQARIEVRVDAPLAGEVWSETYAFEVADVTAPRLVAAQALSTTRIALSFDEPVELGDLDATFIAEDVPAVGLALLEAVADGARVELTIRAPMTPDVRYRVAVRGVHDLKGNPITAPFASATFVGFRPPRPAARRFDLWSMLPRYNRREDTTGDLRKLIACFQEVLDLVLTEIDRFSELFDLERAPEPFVDLMLADLGNPFEFVLNDLDKRRLATRRACFLASSSAPSVRTRAPRSSSVSRSSASTGSSARRVASRSTPSRYAFPSRSRPSNANASAL
jgi:hypothetical protein